MSLIREIAAKRQLLLDGIEANGGDINLRIFEDFYPDEAHFIFELLQNAEDAGATEVSFDLTAKCCTFEHNGTRHFNEQDIRGITGIFNSSKKDSPDKIGKFGVGFKSVFVYTESPIVYSKHFSFRIEQLVLPKEIPPKLNLGDRTRFEFPFNNPKKNVKEAFTEIKFALEQLSENTLLFLRNIGCISWTIGTSEGSILREQHSDSHVEVLKQIDKKDILSTHWLRFSAPVRMDEALGIAVSDVERQHVAVAYELAFTGDRKSFDRQKAIKEQLKIAPAVRGKVSVFFPADKETSGLRFHLHGPFIPELSRASIKNSAENLPLFEQLASLTAESLHKIKKLGLLTGEFLSVLPNSEDLLPERYEVIRQAVIDEMRTQALVPTYRGGHAPAVRLLQARAPLKALLIPEDLSLLTERKDRPDWAIGATQRNSNQDRMLSSLGIETWDTSDLIKVFEKRAREPSSTWDACELSETIIDWLDGKKVEWVQALYATLFKHCEDEGYDKKLEDVYFVKLRSGKWSTAANSFFYTDASSRTQKEFSVDEDIFSVGTRTQQQADARRFLSELGVRAPNEADAMAQLLADAYRADSTPPSNAEYRKHLEAMIAFLEKNPEYQHIFEGARVFKVAALSMAWASAERVYLDEPYAKTGLSELHALLSDQRIKRWPLDGWYQDSGIPVEKIVKFAEVLGCQKEFDQLTQKSSCKYNPDWDFLSKAPGERAGNSINRDFALSNVALQLLKTRKLTAIQLIWRALCRSETTRPTILTACYQLTEKGGPRYADSQLVCTLRELAWVPQTDGSFVKPQDASSSRLPKGLPYDGGHKWLQALQFGSVEAKQALETRTRSSMRKELGFESEDDLQRALEFANEFPPEEQAKILAERRHKKSGSVELPERPLQNSDLRKQRVGRDFQETQNKETVRRERSVSVGAAEAIVEAKVYLQDQYTNSSGQMICQACKDELPFRLASGSYYFEAVELLADSTKRYRATYLALCPNHAAAYRHANAQRSSMADLVASAASSEIEVTLGGIQTTIYFTQTHLADAKACVAVDEEGEVAV